MVDKDSKRVIQKADKFVRNKVYKCLLPGCTERAIRSHAVPRAQCLESLSEGGKVLTLNPSLARLIHRKSNFEPLEIVPMGINDATVFRGYCSKHDTLLFRSAETSQHERKDGMPISLHLRALSVEFCRKRQVIDFYKKVDQLTHNSEFRNLAQHMIEWYSAIASIFSELYLGSLYNMIGGSYVDSVDFYLIPFARNLQVSCCGCFDAEPGAVDSVIGFNLLSYCDMSILVLTLFTAAKKYLDALRKAYPLPELGEQLLNEIAFMHCEEPVIAPQLWRSLSEFDRTQVKLSIRHPMYRTSMPAPRIIKLQTSDFVRKVEPWMLARLPTGLG